MWFIYKLGTVYFVNKFLGVNNKCVGVDGRIVFSICLCVVNVIVLGSFYVV